jgi:nucleoside-diphosphate-sugar epimerase
MSFDETVFITGFPGFIAAAAAQLAVAGAQLLLGAAGVRRAGASDIERIAADKGIPARHFRILQGDITTENLGMSLPELQAARTETTTIFHLAALYDLAVARELGIKINLGGTRNVNTFARSLRNLRRYHYISTCYVAGRRKGLILETELKHQAGFRNYYEESKHLAELEVEALKAELPVTIHRPAVVCGDSHTGETAKYDGIYYLIHYLLRMPRFVSLLNIGNRKVSLNLVPVNFVVEALIALSQDEQAVGKTLQLADPQPLTTHELFNEIAREVNQSGSRVTLPAPLVQFSLSLPPSPAITGLPHHSVPYFFIKQTYDTMQAKELLDQHGIFCPSFSSYVNTIVAFAARHPQL